MARFLVLLAVVAPTNVPGADDPHDENEVFSSVIAEGLSDGGASVAIPGPTFRDGMTAEEQGAALREVAGSSRGVEALLRDSVTAPFVLRLRDERGDGAIIRAGSLYFVLRADLDDIEPDSLFNGTEGGPVEAGNMRFEAELIASDELPGGLAAGGPGADHFVHTTGRLLDRIEVESTSGVRGSKSSESAVVAARTDRRFDGDAAHPNRWTELAAGRGRGEVGPEKPYAGGVGYAKLTRLADHPGALVVEVHFAFAEPMAWFDGAPILRSKLSPVAQDQIRRLRRSLPDRSGGPTR